MRKSKKSENKLRKNSDFGNLLENNRDDMMINHILRYDILSKVIWLEKLEDNDQR